MHQSKPGVRRLRVSQPSIHFPRSVYLPSMKTGTDGFNKFSLGAKNSSLANSTAPPRRSEARSTNSVKSIPVYLLCGFGFFFATLRETTDWFSQSRQEHRKTQRLPLMNS